MFRKLLAVICLIVSIATDYARAQTHSGRMIAFAQVGTERILGTLRPLLGPDGKLIDFEICDESPAQQCELVLKTPELRNQMPVFFDHFERNLQNHLAQSRHDLPRQILLKGARDTAIVAVGALAFYAIYRWAKFPGLSALDLKLLYNGRTIQLTQGLAGTVLSEGYVRPLVRAMTSRLALVLYGSWAGLVIFGNSANYIDHVKRFEEVYQNMAHGFDDNGAPNRGAPNQYAEAHIRDRAQWNRLMRIIAKSAQDAQAELAAQEQEGSSERG